MRDVEAYVESAEAALRDASNFAPDEPQRSCYMAEAQVYASLAQAAATQDVWRVLNNAGALA